MKKLLLIAGLALTAVGFSTVAEAEVGPGPITVDGVQYPADRTTGGATHYETPTPNPKTASNSVHTWTGNGSGNLPCPGGIHWISNENVLTVSHCLADSGSTTTTTTEAPDESTTTTEAPDESTTTIEAPDESTTTIEAPDESVPEGLVGGDGGTVPDTVLDESDTVPEVPATVPDEATTQPTLVAGDSGAVPGSLPVTGARDALGVAIAALGLVLIGLAVVAMARRRENAELI